MVKRKSDRSGEDGEEDGEEDGGVDGGVDGEEDGEEDVEVDVDEDVGAGDGGNSVVNAGAGGAGEVDVSLLNDIPNNDANIDNLHCRISIKNYAKAVSRATANDMLNMISSSSEPINAVNRKEGENLSLSILINIGAGSLEPFIEVKTPSYSRHKTTCAGTHIVVALGINNSGTFGCLDREVLQLIKECAQSQCKQSNQKLKDLKICAGSGLFNTLKIN